MPIDPTPEGPGILNPPIDKPFPEKTDKPDDLHEEAPTANPADDADDLASGESGLPHGAMAEQALAKPPLGN